MRLCGHKFHIVYFDILEKKMTRKPFPITSQPSGIKRDFSVDPPPDAFSPDWTLRLATAAHPNPHHGLEKKKTTKKKEATPQTVEKEEASN